MTNFSFVGDHTILISLPHTSPPPFTSPHTSPVADLTPRHDGPRRLPAGSRRARQRRGQAAQRQEVRRQGHPRAQGFHPSRCQDRHGECREWKKIAKKENEEEGRERAEGGEGGSLFSSSRA